MKRCQVPTLSGQLMCFRQGRNFPPVLGGLAEMERGVFRGNSLGENKGRRRTPGQPPGARARAAGHLRSSGSRFAWTGRPQYRRTARDWGAEGSLGGRLAAATSHLTVLPANFIPWPPIEVLEAPRD